MTATRAVAMGGLVAAIVNDKVQVKAFEMNL